MTFFYSIKGGKLWTSNGVFLEVLNASETFTIGHQAEKGVRKLALHKE
jgi:hypothetical protein